MKRLTVIIFAFPTFIKSTFSALQSLNPPTNPALPEPPTVVTVAGWDYRGCYTDHVDSRTLTGKNWTGHLTPGRCADFCSEYRYYALESGNECYCGNIIGPDSIPAPDVYCADVCNGDPQSVCGGENTLNLYIANPFNSTALPSTLLLPSNSTIDSPKPAPSKRPAPPPAPPVIARVPGWTYRGCWTDNPRDRTLVSKLKKGYITPEKCANVCKGYHFFGLEYSNECYCGDSLSRNARQAPYKACSYICMGDFGSICGGRNALSLYEADDKGVAVS